MLKYYFSYIELRLIENAGTVDEEIIHNSVKYYTINDYTNTNVILEDTTNGIYFFGDIKDNSVDKNTIGILRGTLTMEVLNTGSTPLQANWKVFRKGLSIQGWNFNIPADIIMTKQ